MVYEQAIGRKSATVRLHVGSFVKTTANLVVGLIGLLLVFANQKVVHNIRHEMAEFAVPLRNFF